MTDVTVRVADPADAAAIAELATQLGYPSTSAQVSQRLLEVGARHEHAVFVAESAGALLGWIHVAVAHTLLADATAELGGLVIEERRRSRGLGRLLMERAERWARDHGCRALRLRSNVVRDRAHAFYERLGYRVTKSQKVFTKDLSA